MLRATEDELDYSDEQARLYMGEPFSGIAYDELNGTVISEVLYKNGAREGIARFWYPSGALSTEEVYAKNTRHGLCTEWYENGSLKLQAMYEHGIIINKTEWDASGAITKKYVLNSSSPGYELLSLRRAATDASVD